MKLFALVAALVLGSAAEAATITVGGPGFGNAVDLRPGDFTTPVGATCGSGQSVVGDGCSVVLKDDPTASHAYGRRDPFGGSWIDSQDLAEVTWTFSMDQAFRSLTFALTDAHDQANSFFQLLAGGATWSINTREANGRLHWLTVNFDQPTQSAALVFKTRLNDGWGVSSATVAPVPLPASAWMLIAALGGIGGVARRKRMAA